MSLSFSMTNASLFFIIDDVCWGKNITNDFYCKEIIMDDSFGSRLRQVRKAVGLTQKAFAEHLGAVSLPTVHRLEQRDQYHDELLMALVEKFDVDLHWLLTGASKEQPAVGIPIYAGLKAGDAEPAVVGRIALPGVPDDARAVRVAGDDLLPAVRPGDYAIYVEGLPEEGDLVVYVSELGETRARQYSREDGGVLKAVHPDYPQTRIDRVDVGGKLVQVVRHVELSAT
jgi:transcriptional regulator with XRE-family HTH domain